MTKVGPATPSLAEYHRAILHGLGVGRPAPELLRELEQPGARPPVEPFPEVPAGAVIAAMELVKGLGDNENAMPGMHAMLLLKRCDALTCFNRTRRHTSPRPLSCRQCPEIVSSLVLPRGEG